MDFVNEYFPKFFVPWCSKHFPPLKNGEGAREHCQMGGVLISNARILDWLDDVMLKNKEM